ncbi:hypothetical protein RSAG8_03759, partial [Rhizoctonia solani AG-8 WAC10335]
QVVKSPWGLLQVGIRVDCTEVLSSTTPSSSLELNLHGRFCGLDAKAKLARNLVGDLALGYSAHASMRDDSRPTQNELTNI